VKGHGLISALVIGASLVVAAVAFALVGGLLRGASDTGLETMLARVNREFDEQRARIASLEQAVESMTGDIERLNERAAAGSGHSRASGRPVRRRRAAARGGPRRGRRDR